MTPLPYLSFLLFLSVALVFVPTTQADEQIVYSLPNGGVVSISVVVEVVFTIPTFSNTACPQPTAPPSPCTPTASSPTVPTGPSCDVAAGYSNCPGVGCCSPGSQCQGNGCVASTTCNYAAEEVPCGSICCASGQYCGHSGLCLAVGGFSPPLRPTSSSVATYSPPFRPTSSSITTQSPLGCSSGYHSCPASLGGGCCQSGRACGSGGLCPPLSTITDTMSASDSITEPFQSPVPSATMTPLVTSASNTTTATFISPVATGITASCASPCGTSGQLCCRPNEACTSSIANQYICDCLKPCGSRGQLCCGDSESCTTDANNQALCAASAMSTPPPNSSCAHPCGYYGQLCCGVSQICTTSNGQALCAPSPTLPPNPGCTNPCGWAGQFCCNAGQKCITSNHVALCVQAMSSSECAKPCGYYGQLCCGNDQCCSTNSNTQAICTSCNPPITPGSSTTTSLSITTVTITAQGSSVAARH